MQRLMERARRQITLPRSATLLVCFGAPLLTVSLHQGRSNAHRMTFASSGAYNKVAVSLLQQAGVAKSEADRPQLVIEAYEKCLGTVLSMHRSLTPEFPG